MGVEFKADTFDYEVEYEKIKREVVKPNILLCGATGVGKSSLVNDVFSEHLARVGVGEPITKGVHCHPGDTLNIYDSEGYEIGSERQDYYREEIIACIDRKRRENPEDQSNQIHEVWYCISAANKRITDTDLAIIREIQGKKVPVALVLTQVDGVAESELSDLKKAIKRELDQIEFFTYAITEDEQVRLILKPYIQKEELITWAITVLDDYLQEGLIIALKGCIDKKRDHVLKRLIPQYTAAAAGVALSPIPFSDAALLMPIQMTMTMHIFNVYGLYKLKGVATNLLEAQILSQVGKIIATTLVGNLTKLIPGIGTAIGITVNAGVASTITLGLGLTVSNMCLKYSRAVLDGKAVDLEDYFGVDQFNQIFELVIEKVKKNG